MNLLRLAQSQEIAEKPDLYLQLTKFSTYSVITKVSNRATLPRKWLSKTPGIIQVVLHTLAVPKINPVTSFIHTDESLKHLGFSSKEHLLV